MVNFKVPMMGVASFNPGIVCKGIHGIPRVELWQRRWKISVELVDGLDAGRSQSKALIDRAVEGSCVRPQRHFQIVLGILAARGNGIVIKSIHSMNGRVGKKLTSDS